jgi:GGDEF domain-containing protein
LPNRSLLDQFVSQALLTARRNSGYSAVLVVGSQRFSTINSRK